MQHVYELLIPAPGCQPASHERSTPHLQVIPNNSFPCAHEHHLGHVQGGAMPLLIPLPGATNVPALPCPGERCVGWTCEVCLHSTTCSVRGGEDFPSPPAPPFKPAGWTSEEPLLFQALISHDSQLVLFWSSPSQGPGIRIFPKANAKCHAPPWHPR